MEDRLIREHGLSRTAIHEALTRAIGVERVEASGEGWLVANNDCVPETEAMEADSVDLIVTSIPFANHYEYTPSYLDFGHTDDNAHFWAQMDYLTPQLHRVLRPERLYACHVKDRILYGNMTGAGYSTVSPFHAEAILHGQRHGFEYLGMITVVTDVVRENNQSYRLGYAENAKDSSKMGVGSPEYVLIFRKPQTDRTRGYADTPVTKDKSAYSLARWQVDAHAYWRSSGNRHLTPAELAALPADQLYRLWEQHSLGQVYDYQVHVRIGEALQGRGALPSTFMLLAPASWHPDVWHDINRMATLNTDQSRRAQQQHVCPLQFDIVDRLITRYSNPGELVYDPFGGLFTVPSGPYTSAGGAGPSSSTPATSPTASATSKPPNATSPHPPCSTSTPKPQVNPPHPGHPARAEIGFTGHTAVPPRPTTARLPAPVRHRRPAHHPLLQPRRAGLRPLRRPVHRPRPGPTPRPAGPGGRAQPPLLRRRRRLPPSHPDPGGARIRGHPRLGEHSVAGRRRGKRVITSDGVRVFNKNANREGSVYRQADGCWCATWWEPGRARPRKATGKTREMAIQRREKGQAESGLNAGELRNLGRLAEWWLHNVHKQGVRPLVMGEG